MAHTQIFTAPTFAPPIDKPAHRKSHPAPGINMARRHLPPLTWRLAASLFRSVYHLEVTGRELIPRHGSCVFVANHTSHLDTFLLASQLPRQRRAGAVPMAAADFIFHNRVLSTLSSQVLNAVPLRRDAGHRHELSFLRDELKQAGHDWSYLLFPEGTRSRNGCLLEFRAGVGTLVAGSSVPVVPCHISGAFEAWPADKKLPRPRGRLTLHFGAPMQFRDLPNQRRGWNQVAEELHSRAGGAGGLSREGAARIEIPAASCGVFTLFKKTQQNHCLRRNQLRPKGRGIEPT